MKNIILAISLLLFTTIANSTEVTSREGKASSNVLGVQCDNGKNIVVTYNYTTEHYEVTGRYFNMFRHAVTFGCK
ncbi:MAG: hypothetical protein JKX75_04055 [Gammaproteobacteria bacterium]|nr:hypothetical protein [Gammaproteobacteria bacterium]